MLNFPLPELRLPDLALESWRGAGDARQVRPDGLPGARGRRAPPRAGLQRAICSTPRGSTRCSRQSEPLLAQAAEDPERPVGRAVAAHPGGAAACCPIRRRPLDGPGWARCGDLVSARGAAAPERPAVDRGRGRPAGLTYGELEARANRLAHRLLGSALGRGEVVAVWAHRSAAADRRGARHPQGRRRLLLLDPAYPAAAWRRSSSSPAPPPGCGWRPPGAARRGRRLPQRSVPLARRLVLPPGRRRIPSPPSRRSRRSRRHRGRPGRPRLPRLHLGLDRRTQGDPRPARPAHPLPALAGAGASASGPTTASACSRGSPTTRCSATCSRRSAWAARSASPTRAR